MAHVNKFSARLLLLTVIIGMVASAQADPRPGDTVTGTGTIEFIEVEGGFYGLIADDGTHYFPQNLSEDFEINGTKVRFELTIAEQQDSFYMWGTRVQIDFIQPVLEIGTTANGTGFVRYISEEEYGITTDDGFRLTPANLPEEFRANGTYIQFEYTVADGQSNTSWGTAVTLANVKPASIASTDNGLGWWFYTVIILILAAFFVLIFKINYRRGG